MSWNRGSPWIGPLSECPPLTPRPLRTPGTQSSHYAAVRTVNPVLTLDLVDSGKSEQNQTPQLNLLYIGSVPIRSDHSGGSVVLWRHQQLFTCGTITSAPEDLGYRPALGLKIWKLLRRIRLGRLALILQPWLRAIDGHLASSQRAQIAHQADAILTVAHGLGWIEAMAVSHICHLPLITIAHDWYPDDSGCPPWGLWIWELSFRRLFERSSLVLAVSVGMARAIAPHPKLKVLPPIPDPVLQPCPPSQPHQGPWRLYYSGLCGGLYRPSLEVLISAVAMDARFSLHCSGPEFHTLEIPPSNPRFRGSRFLEGSEWQQAFDEADALILVLSFARRHRRLMATHFPSKLVEYINRSRPIVIWGPAWSSAVQWGMNRSGILVFTQPDADMLLSEANNWLCTRPVLANDASMTAAFIQRQFEDYVCNLIRG